MARTIKEIQQPMIDSIMGERPDLSKSAVAEWRLWTFIVATAIHVFEVILDLFRKEVDAMADKITPGTARWYAEQVKRFQNGHELLFDQQTAQLYYAEDDPAARIVEIVAVAEEPKRLRIKVAKLNDQNKVTPLTADELHNFTGYIDSIKFAGIESVAISTVADKIRYSVEVYYNPAVPMTTVRNKVLSALDDFRAALDFNSMLYRQRFIDAIMRVDGVVTVELLSMERKGIGMDDFEPVGVADELESGYFDYDDENILTMISIAK